MAQMTLEQAMRAALQYHQAGKLAEAEGLYRQVLAVVPDYPDALNLLGVLAAQLGHHDAGIDLIRQAIRQRPAEANFHCNLGKIHMDQGQYDQAVAVFREALRHAELPMVHNNLGLSLQAKGELDAALDSYRAALRLQPDFSETHSNLVYALHFHPGYDAPKLLAEHRLWNQQHAAPLKNLLRPHGNERSPERRLRVGYLSPDFTGHVVGRFIEPLLVARDRKAFEVFCYSDVQRSDALTERLKASVDTWRPIAMQSHEQVAERVREDRIDILVDLTMHMAGNRMLVFARKPAPVQVTYLAYCSTTGLDTMDYRLTDPYLDPPEMNESCYTEKSLRLPETYWCYTQPPAAPAVNELPAARAGQVTFGCLNSFSKVSESALQAWGRILQAVPGSQLVLYAFAGDHRDRAQGVLTKLGVDPGRCRFVGLASLGEYFQRYHEIDIGLDPFPYAGGTTTCDALWMGVPVVTPAGKTAVGRGGVSILSNVGLPELVGRSTDDYVRIAVGLAGDLPELAVLRAELRGRMGKSPLMDAPRFARGVEAAFRKMWQGWCASSP